MFFSVTALSQREVDLATLPIGITINSRKNLRERSIVNATEFRFGNADYLRRPGKPQLKLFSGLIVRQRLFGSDSVPDSGK